MTTINEITFVHTRFSLSENTNIDKIQLINILDSMYVEWGDEPDYTNWLFSTINKLANINVITQEKTLIELISFSSRIPRSQLPQKITNLLLQIRNFNDIQINEIVNEFNFFPKKNYTTLLINLINDIRQIIIIHYMSKNYSTINKEKITSFVASMLNDKILINKDTLKFLCSEFKKYINSFKITIV
jgi:hypothetical protein